MPITTKERTMETTSLPRLSPAMTAGDLNAHVNALRAGIGPDASVHVFSMDGEYPAYLTLRPQGVCSEEGRQTFHGASWDDVILAAQKWVASRPAIQRDTLIRQLALAIIDLTDQHGKCTAGLLRNRKFALDDIRRYHEAACVRAGEMAGCAPFKVEFAGDAK